MQNQEQFSIRAVVSTLAEAAGPHLTPEQLKLFAGALHEARIMAVAAKQLSEGLALVLVDDKAGSNWMQDDAPHIAQHFAGTFDTVAALIDLSMTAQSLLEQQS